MILKRIHKDDCYDLRLLPNGESLEVRTTSKGRWIRTKPGICQSECMKSKSLFSESELKTAKDIFKLVSKLQFHSCRVSLLATGREICRDNTSDEYLNKALALTIETHPERTYCKTFNVKEDLNIIETWLKEIKKLERLPIFSLEKVQVEAIVFSPSSFGFILHELLGHRLESDDYSQPLEIGSEKCANYIAEDTIGAEGLM